jgi:hypothetical protein
MFRTVRSLVVSTAVAAVVTLPLAAQQATTHETVDLDAVYKIKDEGLQRSQVMTLLSWMTDVHGSRLTGSPSYKAAADWAAKSFTEWGLTNVKQEPFEFGQGWSNDRFTMHVVEPNRYSVIAYPKAWTTGTNGAVTAEAIVAVIESEADFEKFRGQLKGKIVLTQPLREVKASFEPLGTRYSEKQLDELSTIEEPGRPRRAVAPGMFQFGAKRMEFLKSEGVLATLEPSRMGDGGTVFVQGGGPRNPKEPQAIPQVVMAVEHYGRIFRTLDKKVPVKIELDIANTFQTADLNGYNIVAEIAGTDKVKGAEVVMLGGHFDGWHGGTGATDNAAGSAVMMEAMRILKTSGLKMKRTVRIGLWGGEEQGLLGSQAYVKQHFADRETMKTLPDYDKFSAYFNVDNGTGAIRGIYLQGNEAVSPIFSAWMQPLRSLGMTALTPRNTGGTDHLRFDAVGLPGFQFIQDEVEYNTRTHHSNMDVYERVQAGDMIKNAVIVASFVYHAANRDDLLPRKPKPAPQSAPQRPAGTPAGGQ